MQFRWLGLALAFAVMANLAYAGSYADVAIISSTMGVNGNHLCLGEATRGDIGCPGYAPTVDAGGVISATGLTIGGVSITSGKASSLVSLTDVSASAPANNSLLRYNTGTSKWEAVGINNGVSTTTMAPDWPDAIVCRNGNDSHFLYMRYYDATNIIQYSDPADSKNDRFYMEFNPDGSYNSNVNFTGYDCLSKSISQLYAAGQAFNFLGNNGSGGSGGSGDAIVSGTTTVQVNSATAIVSLTTSGTTWGYLGSGTSYLPTLSANKLSGTTISSTYIQVASASTVLSCSSGGAGTMRYTSGTMQVCNGTDWTNIGIGVPTGTIAAFATSSCPSGWSEYTPSRGRFLRGIDNGAGNDPSGTRVAGSAQGDAFQDHWHNAVSTDGGSGAGGKYIARATTYGGENNLGVYGQSGVPNGSPAVQEPVENPIGTAGTPRIANETRPKNVAVTFCQYNGYGSEVEAGISTLNGLSDVSVGSATSGQALVFDGASWVPSTTTATGSTQGDRIVSGSASIIAESGGDISVTANTLDVAGKIRATSDASDCSTDTIGAFRFNPSTGKPQICRTQ